ncbi:MAG: class I SAM-dependent methyltransferase [Cyclobacteriaceae bacterium]
MINFSSRPSKTIEQGNILIHSFMSTSENNIDWTTVNSFGNEWKKFDHFNESEIQRIGNDYFDLVDERIANNNSLSLDVGCGSGRWARFLSSKVNFIEAIDPSASVFPAAEYLKDKKNVRISQASVDNIPFQDNSFDFVYSLGVLHHIPDTLAAIGNCYQKIKPGGWFLLYLYYSLENRNFIYRSIFEVSSVFRHFISKLPQGMKQVVCDIIAFTIYLPLALASKLLYSISPLKKIALALPLSYYRNTSLRVMRNDSLDRFGTPLEKRFTKKEIEDMLQQNNFINIKFSQNPPYWHVIAQKPQ